MIYRLADSTNIDTGTAGRCVGLPRVTRESSNTGPGRAYYCVAATSTRRENKVMSEQNNKRFYRVTTWKMDGAYFTIFEPQNQNNSC